MTDRTKTIVIYAMSLCSILAMMFLFLALWLQQRSSPEYVTTASTLYPDFYYDSLYRKAQNVEREQPAPAPTSKPWKPRSGPGSAAPSCSMISTGCATAGWTT